jgi:hypothetical protein
MRYTTERADTAMTAAFDAAERVMVLLDRHAGFSGDNPDVIETWENRLRQLEREIVEAIGEPPVMVRLACGGMVHQSFLDIYREAKP